MLPCKYLIRLICLIFLHFVHGQEQCFEDGRYYTMAGGVTWNNTIEYGPNLCQKRCQKEAKCSYWVYHKPTITCSLQAGKDNSYYETDYISGPKYCDCYEDDTVYLDSPTIVIKETMEDCRMECQKLSPLLIVCMRKHFTTSSYFSQMLLVVVKIMLTIYMLVFYNNR